MTLELKTAQKIRQRFLATVTKRLPLRLHMSVIVLATVGAGILATKGLHFIHLENVAIRYPLSVLIAYGAFLLTVRLWLKYASHLLLPPAENDSAPHAYDLLPDGPLGDMAVITPGDHPSGHFAGFRGGGSGGGGASRGFGESSLSSGNNIGDTVADGAGSVASGLDDEAGIPVLVILAVLALVLAVIFGSSLYLIYQGPVILSETAFECILAASLVRGTRSLEQADWVGSILKRTWIPFTLTMVLTLIAGLLILYYFPGVTSISELSRRLMAL